MKLQSILDCIDKTKKIHIYDYVDGKSKNEYDFNNVDYIKQWEKYQLYTETKDVLNICLQLDVINIFIQNGFSHVASKEQKSSKKDGLLKKLFTTWQN